MRTCRLTSVVSLAGVLTLSAAPARADEARASAGDYIDPGVNLEQLLNLRVVTASGGVAEERSLAPASVVAFTREDIARHGWRSVGEVLENVPGIDVIDDHVLSSVGVRGVTGGFRAGTRVVKVMIDGLAVNFRPDLAAFIGPEYIPIEAVERIEIAKGPLSAIYGANAFVAVVNVITRQAGEATIATVSLRSNLIRSAPGYGLSAMVADKSGPLELVAAFSSDRLDRSGLRMTRTFPAQDPATPRYAGFFTDASQGDVAQPTSAFLSLRAPGRWGTVSVEGGVQQLDSMAEFQLSSVLTHASRVAINNYWTQARYDRSLSDQLRFGAMAGYSRGSPTRDEILYLTGNYDSAFTRNFQYQAFDGGLQLAYTPFAALSAVVGADGSYEPQRTLYYTQIFHSVQGVNLPGSRKDILGDDDLRTAVLSNVGVYGQVALTPIRALPSLRLTGNLRFDVPNLFPVQYSWRAAAAYRFGSGLTAKLFGGRAFQAPSAVLLYGHPGFGAANNVVGSLTRAGPGLRPQVVTSVEGAVSASLANLLTVEANLYYQWTDKEIGFLPAASDFIARNQGSRSMVGLEMSLQAQVLRVLRPYVAAAVQRAPATWALDAEPPPLYPNYWLRGGVEVEAPDAHVRSAVQVRWVGPRTASDSNVLLDNLTSYQLPGFAEVDAAVSTVGWRPFRPGPELTLALRVKNLLDNRRPVPGFGGMDIPALGRVAMLELGYAR